jgi:hypothetical protein
MNIKKVEECKDKWNIGRRFFKEKDGRNKERGRDRMFKRRE